MKLIKVQQNIFPKIVVVFLMVSLLVTPLTPLSAQGVDQLEQNKAVQSLVQKRPLAQVIDIPEVIIGTSTVANISLVDWDQKIEVGGKKVSLSSEEGLASIELSPVIQKLVEAYHGDITSIESALFAPSSLKLEKKKHATEALQYGIAQSLIEEGLLPNDYFELLAQGFIEPADNLIDAKKAFIKKPGAIKAMKAEVVPEVTIVDITTVEGGQINKNKEKSSPLGSLWNTVTGIVSDIGGFVGNQFAKSGTASKTAEVSGTSNGITESSAALISGNASAQSALQYLVSHQNTDGSWGSGNSLLTTTSAVLDALDVYGEIGPEYQKGITWIESYITDNNDYRAQQAKRLARAGRTISELESIASTIDDSTGGFSYDVGYQADPATTAKVLQALTEAGFEDSGSSPRATRTLALYYLTQTQRFDKGWSLFDDGASSLPVTTDVINALLPYKGQSLLGVGSSKIVIDSTIKPALDSLKATQMSDGSWGGDLLNTAVVVQTLKKGKTAATYARESISYLENAQGVDGSFGGGDIYLTAQVLKALATPEPSVGNLAVTDIASTNPLQTRTPAGIKITITNSGDLVANSGILHLVADHYLMGSFNLASSSLVINPHTSAQITVNISNTAGYVGDVAFDAFIEGVGDVIYASSRYQKTLTFAEDPTHLPGLPIYFTAQKHIIDGQPALNVRWGKKSDPNRLNYLIMWRVVGETSWNTYPIANDKNGAFISPYVEDQLYEVTVGAVTADGTKYTYYSSPVQVRVSADANKYTSGTVSGTMRDVNGPVGNISLLAGGDFATVDADGNFNLTHVPYGKGWVRASNFRYEDYVTTFKTSDSTVINHKAYTNLVPDIATPTITYFAMANEADYKMENLETKFIHLGVADDIGITGTGIVASASFSYYDPHDSTWHSIGTMQGPLSSTVGYSWNVPGTLFGPGYKIRATIRDYSGKESEPTEWGPFEFTQGNATPEFAFVTPLSATTTVADLSHTIVWTDNDNDDNARILLSYDPDDTLDNVNHTNITTLYEDDVVDQYIWDTSNIPEGTYYLFALVSDNHNANQVIHSPQRVTITHSAPTPPSLLRAEGKTNPTNITDPTPEFSAVYNDLNVGDVAKKYRIQVATSTTFTSTKWDSGMALLASSTPRGFRTKDISYTGSLLASSTPYYWRIKFWDTAGSEGSWSTTTASFSLAPSTNSSPTPPTSLQVEGKANPVTITNPLPKFSAVYNDLNLGDQAKKYQIQVATSTTFVSTKWDSGMKVLATSTPRGGRIQSVTYNGSSLASSTQYYWRIKLWDANSNEGAWSTTTASFSLAASTSKPPLAPTELRTEGLVDPINVTDSTPEFSAVYNDPNIGDMAKKYQIQVATSTTFTSLAWNSGTVLLATSTPRSGRTYAIAYTGSTLASSTTYYWRIRLWDTAGNEGLWSTTTASFLLLPKNNIPTAPTSLQTEGLTNPTNIIDSTPDFSAIYNDVDLGDLAKRYRIQVSTSTTFSTLKWDSGTTLLASLTPIGSRITDVSYSGSSLASSTTYYWRIRFWDTREGGGAWSSRSSFSLK